MAEKPRSLSRWTCRPAPAPIYPPPYAAALAGRAKRALGDLFGLSQFGVNLTVLAPGAPVCRSATGMRARTSSSMCSRAR